jgi:hypothetical protein
MIGVWMAGVIVPRRKKPDHSRLHHRFLFNPLVNVTQVDYAARPRALPPLLHIQGADRTIQRMQLAVAVHTGH